MLTDQIVGVKRSYHNMMEQARECGITMDGMAYPDYSQGAYYAPAPPPPPPNSVLFSNPNPFPSPVDYVAEGYIPSSDVFHFGNRSLSEPFVHGQNSSFESSSSASSTCGASNGPATPPPQAYVPTMTKYPAVPITPSHHIPRTKAKRTATACEECRKRKQKCDGEGPCQSCKEQKLECKYREVSPTKKDNSMDKLVSLVELCSKSMEALNQRLDAMTSTLHQIENRLRRCYQCGAAVELETGTCHSCNQVGCNV